MDAVEERERLTSPSMPNKSDCQERAPAAAAAAVFGILHVILSLFSCFLSFAERSIGTSGMTSHERRLKPLPCMSLLYRPKA